MQVEEESASAAHALEEGAAAAVARTPDEDTGVVGGGAPDEVANVGVGPDPVVGMGIGVAGLLIMAVGGAGNWHYCFNVGEALLLAGAALFIGSVVVSVLKQEPLDWRGRLSRLLDRAKKTERG